MSVVEFSTSVCSKHSSSVVFADACDLRVLEAAMDLQERDLIIPVLIAKPQQVQAIANENKLRLKGIYCYDHLRCDILNKNARKYKEIQEAKDKDVSIEESLVFAKNPLVAAAIMLRDGEVDMGIGGNISSTADVLRAGLRVLGVAENTDTIFSFFFMISPDREKVYIFADCAVIPEPSAEQLAGIALSSAKIFEGMLRKKAKVAMLSFSTKGSSKHPSIEKILDALDIAQKKDANLLIDGELQFDAAVVPEVGNIKAPGSKIAGQANVFIFPSLEAGNIAYKIAEHLGGFTSLGPLLYGFPKSWHDVSRGCSAKDIVKVAITGMGIHHCLNNV